MRAMRGWVVLLELSHRPGPITRWQGDYSCRSLQGLPCEGGWHIQQSSEPKSGGYVLSGSHSSVPFCAPLPACWVLCSVACPHFCSASQQRQNTIKYHKLPHTAPASSWSPCCLPSARHWWWHWSQTALVNPRCGRSPYPQPGCT